MNIKGKKNRIVTGPEMAEGTGAESALGEVSARQEAGTLATEREGGGVGAGASRWQGRWRSRTQAALSPRAVKRYVCAHRGACSPR